MLFLLNIKIYHYKPSFFTTKQKSLIKCHIIIGRSKLKNYQNLDYLIIVICMFIEWTSWAILGILNL